MMELIALRQPSRRVRFVAIGREMHCAEGENLFQAARREGIRIVGACGGRGACGSCLIRAVDGALALREDDEAPDGARKWVRACRAIPQTDCEIEIAPRSLAAVARLDVHAENSRAEPIDDPCIEIVEVETAPPTLEDNVSDLDRLRRAAPRKFVTAGLAALRAAPAVLRADEGWASLVLRGPELIAVAPRGQKLFGLAIDLGTTNIVGYLVDLRAKAPVASLGIENPQAAWGADLVSRINHAMLARARPTNCKRRRAGAQCAGPTI